MVFINFLLATITVPADSAAADKVLRSVARSLQGVNEIVR